MKSRQGFVSNSSSSSFIISLAIVPADKVDAFKNEMLQNKVDSWEAELVQVQKLLEGEGMDNATIQLDTDELGNRTLKRIDLEAFDCSSVCIGSCDLKDVSPLDYVFAYYGTYGDDSDFYEYDEDGEIMDYDPNYNIDEDFFPIGMQNGANLAFSDNALHGTMTYGAGRNG